MVSCLLLTGGLVMKDVRDLAPYLICGRGTKKIVDALHYPLRVPVALYDFPLSLSPLRIIGDD